MSRSQNKIGGGKGNKNREIQGGDGSRAGELEKQEGEKKLMIGQETGSIRRISRRFYQRYFIIVVFF